MESFELILGFPQPVGAIDGTHIPIIRPQYSPADYYNRKGLCKDLWTFVVFLWMCILDGQARSMMLMYLRIQSYSKEATKAPYFQTGRYFRSTGNTYEL